MKEWYSIDNIVQLDSPSLVVYPDRVRENIKVLLNLVPDPQRLRPHVKTNKSIEISKLLLDAGITKFKCATIAEAEMLAIAGAPDVLLAYQPVGPKAQRVRSLVDKYKKTKFSCLVDTVKAAAHLSEIFQDATHPIQVYIDLNVGMNRTGILPSKAFALYLECEKLMGITVVGLHAYDGHIRDADFEARSKRCDDAFATVLALKNEILKASGASLTLVMGGTPTFPIHAKRKDVECSPGTFIYWDMGYQQLLTEQPFLIAALVVTRVISKPTDTMLCLDLGHKAIASENPIDKRVFFLNGPDLKPVGHSEEHLVVEVPAGNSYEVGDVFYGIPYHICPTVALHDVVAVVEKHRVTTTWKTASRTRTISV